MSKIKVERLDLFCAEHEAVLQSLQQVTVLVPVDKHSTPVDFSLGWELDLAVLECPEDSNGDCCDSWEAHLVT